MVCVLLNLDLKWFIMLLSMSFMCKTRAQHAEFQNTGEVQGINSSLYNIHKI